MKQIVEQLSNMLAQVRTAIGQVDLPAQELELERKESSIIEPGFWQDSANAELISSEAANLRKYIVSWRELESDLATTLELAELSDEAQQEEFGSQLSRLAARYDAMMIELKLNAEFDAGPAVVQISAGVGGTDAQDWAEMLMNMYVRYCDKAGFKAELVSVSYGEEAGIKSATLEVSGRYAYGKLKCEKGVHRLVRLSPFNSQNLRQTSFALIDVIPEIPVESVNINADDLRIDVFRSGGHGGQSVNTTDSAVRITHLPTNTVVSIQNERSQLKNKEKAMSILASRLAEIAREQQLEDIAQIRGKVKSADWGAQIRSYVMQPYTKVKDHRTDFETSDVNGVLGGDVEPFIEAYLTQSVGENSAS
jgi:peptide chain release factor 2